MRRLGLGALLVALLIAGASLGSGGARAQVPCGTPLSPSCTTTTDTTPAPAPEPTTTASTTPTPPPPNPPITPELYGRLDSFLTAQAQGQAKYRAACLALSDTHDILAAYRTACRKDLQAGESYAAYRHCRGYDRCFLRVQDFSETLDDELRALMYISNYAFTSIPAGACRAAIAIPDTTLRHFKRLDTAWATIYRAYQASSMAIYRRGVRMLKHLGPTGRTNRQQLDAFHASCR